MSKNYVAHSRKGARGERRNKGIKAARDQERRERAYARGGTKPREKAG